MVGDVHCKFKSFRDIVKNLPSNSLPIQVGDFGVGFPEWESDKAPLDGLSYKFIRGNHDNPGVCKSLGTYIPDGYYDEDLRAFFCGGGFSIDRNYRTEGLNYWSDEELTYKEFSPIVDLYYRSKPRIVVTHEPPASLIPLIAPNTAGKICPSRTSQCFQTMLDTIHRPEVWVFGHYHLSWSSTIDGTLFRCLDELEVAQIDLPV